MLVNARCKKCGETGKLDIGEMTKEEVIYNLKKQKTFECFGNHVELTTPLDFLEIDWDSIAEGNSPTEEEFIADLKEKYSLVFNTDELREKYIIEYFAYGMATAIEKETNEKIGFRFANSPKGIRYYYA